MSGRFNAFVAPARARAALWRVLGALALFSALLLGGGALIGAALGRIGLGGIGRELARLETPRAALFALSTFLIWWLALWLALRIFHRRGLSTLFAPPPGSERRRGRARRFALGFAAAAAFGVAGLIGGVALAGWPSLSAPSFGAWAGAAALATPLLLIQTGAEEALFRGYLLQQLGARFRSPVIWAALPSMAFGLLHWNPAAPGGAMAAVLATGLLGFLLALLTARSGDLFAAWGVHFGVNLFAILAVSSPDYFGGLALFHWPGDALPRLVWLDFALIALFGLGGLWLSRVQRDGRARL